MDINKKPSSEANNDKDKTLSSQVIEYYKRYSQNRELPKYFSGASTSTFKIDDWYERMRKSPVISASGTNDEISEDVYIKPLLSLSISPLAGQDQPVINVTSPTSSVTSNRKLEWDNGADIGYSNVDEGDNDNSMSLRKSISLPVLNTLEYKKLRESLLNVSDKKHVQLKESNDNEDVGLDKLVPAYSSSSTSESTKSLKGMYTITSASSSSPSTPEIQQYVSSDTELISEKFKRLRNHRRKDGGCSPIAESTRIMEKDSETLKDSVHVDLNLVDRISFYKNMKMLKLGIAKPVVVECKGIYELSPGRDKIIQTSLPRNPSIATQTDRDFSSGIIRVVNLRRSEKQQVLYVCHSDSDKETNDQSSSAATQTDSNTLSNCNSFEYLSGEEYDRNIQKPSPPIVFDVEPLPSCSGFNLRKCPPKSDQAMMMISTQSSDFISSSSSADLSKQSKDLEKKLQLLRKVIKSKKYDKNTKKHCLNKIIQTMIDSKSSDSSAGDKKLSSSTTTNGMGSVGSDSTKDGENKLNLHENRPWVPIQLEESSLPPSKKFQIQTFTNEIPAMDRPASSENESKSVGSEKPRLPRNQFLTLTDGNDLCAMKDRLETDQKYDHGDNSNSTNTNELYDTIQSENVASLISSASSKNNWRDDKTHSEELLEQKPATTKDNLVGYARKEREQQLYWINSEISHLCKLKNLLERNQHSNNNDLQVQHNILHRFLDKPRIEDMKGVTKSTTLYVVTTERCNDTSKSSPIHCECGKGCQKKCIKGHFISPTGSSRSTSPTNKHIKFKHEELSSKTKSCICDKNKNRQHPNSNAPCPCNKQASADLSLQLPSSTNADKSFINIEEGNINLKNARLISSEQFTADSDNLQYQTSVRRYTFEIPMDSFSGKICNPKSPTKHPCAKSSEGTSRSCSPPPRLPPLLECNEGKTSLTVTIPCTTMDTKDTNTNRCPRDDKLLQTHCINKQDQATCPGGGHATQVSLSQNIQTINSSEQVTQTTFSLKDQSISCTGQATKPLFTFKNVQERLQETQAPCSDKPRTTQTFSISTRSQGTRSCVKENQLSQTSYLCNKDQATSSSCGLLPIKAPCISRNSPSPCSCGQKKQFSRTICLCKDDQPTSSCKVSSISRNTQATCSCIQKNQFSQTLCACKKDQATTLDGQLSQISLADQNIQACSCGPRGTQTSFFPPLLENQGSQTFSINTKDRETSSGLQGCQFSQTTCICAKDQETSPCDVQEIPFSHKKIQASCTCPKGTQTCNCHKALQENETSQTCFNNCRNQATHSERQSFYSDKDAQAFCSALRGTQTASCACPVNEQETQTCICQKDVETPDDEEVETIFCNMDEAPQTCNQTCNERETQACFAKPNRERASSINFNEDYKLCQCCKKHYALSEKSRSRLRPQSQFDTHKYILCYPCYYYNQGQLYYTYPGHVCTCYNNQVSDTVQQMRDTIVELEHIEKQEEYCKCSYKGKTRSSSGYCSNCKCKFREHKGGLAYAITFESNENLNNEEDECNLRMPELEEIKIIIPSPRRKCRKTSCGDRNNMKCNQRNTATLQECLCTNKPAFVESAEHRRKCLLELAYLREQRCQKYKQLLAMTNGISSKNGGKKSMLKKHLFTIKEMKQITARHYKKLPEVQQKLEDIKERRVRKANILLAGIFNQKLRQRVLKGNPTIAADASIINLA